jgi:superfamily II DNA or RNA helicase
MELSFAVKEPDKAYVSHSLWLPKSQVRAGPVQRALEFIIQSEQGQIMMRLWKESANHIICPREFLPESEYLKYDFPFVNLRPEFNKVVFKDNVVPRNEEQLKAWEALAANNNGILNLGCGKGKTVLANKKIAQMQVPALIVVPDKGILQQWEDAVGKFIEFDGEMGLIQGNVFRWAHPITIALVTTLWKRIEAGLIPEEMFRYFGLIIYDEVHRIGAPKFSLTASPFYGDRIGLTATSQREDGLDPIFKYHIGDVFYSDLSQQLVPDIAFQQTPANINWRAAEVNGATNISVLRTILAHDKVANVFRYWHLKAALEHGRKILALSHSKHQLRLLHAMFPGSGLIVQETKDRMNVLRNHQLVFAIAKLGSEGVDDDRLDTLFLLTPFRSKNALQQCMGRIQRLCEGKKKPLMVYFEDWMATPIKKLCSAVKTELRKWGYNFSVLKPNNLPTELPPEADAAYEAMFSQLTKIEEDTEDEQP